MGNSLVNSSGPPLPLANARCRTKIYIPSFSRLFTDKSYFDAKNRDTEPRQSRVL